MQPRHKNEKRIPFELTPDIEERIIEEANYMIQTRCTIRQLAEVFPMSKTCIHRDLVKILPYISSELSESVREILDKNSLEKCTRGGAKTRLLYSKNKK